MNTRSPDRPTAAQLATLRRIRAMRNDYEIAPTEFVDGILRVYFNKTRVSILSDRSRNYDGTFMSEPYGTRQIGRFGTVTVDRPVDLLAG